MDQLCIVGKMLTSPQMVRRKSHERSRSCGATERAYSKPQGGRQGKAGQRTAREKLICCSWARGCSVRDSNLSPCESASGVKEELGQPVATHSK